MKRHLTVRKLAGLFFAAFVSGTAAAAPGDPLGPTVKVNLLDAFNQEYSQGLIAFDDGFRVLWTALGGQYHTYHQTLFGRGGERLSGDLPWAAQNSGGRVSTATPDGRFTALYQAWQGEPALWVQRHDAAGVPAGAAIRVTEPLPAGTLLGSNHSIAANASGEFVVAWEQQTESKGAVNCGALSPLRRCLGTFQTRLMTRHFTAAGTPSAPVVIHTATRYDAIEYAVDVLSGEEIDNPSVALGNDGGLAVAWRSTLHAGFPAVQQIKLRYFPPTGTAPVARIVEAAGAHPHTPHPEVVMDGRGNIVVAYRKGSFSNPSIWMRRYAVATSNALGPATRVDSKDHASTTPGGIALASDGQGGFAIAWNIAENVGIYLQRYGVEGEARGGHTLVSTDGRGFYETPLLAMRNGRLAVAWMQYQAAGEDRQIRARFYDGP